MDKFRSALCASLFAAMTFTFTSMAQAQATRTWISGVGDDVNPCSRTAPCKTFAGAISKTAAGGEINAIDPGGFGAVTITKSITIDGAGTHASILACGTSGVTINDSATGAPNSIKVVLRNLSINGCGNTASPGANGIKFTGGRHLVVENVVIDGFREHGIYVDAKAAVQVFIKDTVIRNNGGAGINVVSNKNRVGLSGVALVFNGAGLTAPAGVVDTFSNNVIYGNLKGDPPVPPAPR